MQNVFRNKNFVLIFLGALVSNIVSLFYSFAVSYWILDITNNNAIIQGAYLGTCGLTFVLFSLIGGVLSDRFNKAKLMYICDYIKGVLIIGSSVIISVPHQCKKLIRGGTCWSATGIWELSGLSGYISINLRLLEN